MTKECNDDTYIDDQNNNQITKKYFDYKSVDSLNDDGKEYENEENEIRKHYYVYKHTNLINNKCYIGITSLDINYRWRKNGEAYIRKNKNGKFYHQKFAAAINKYGWDNFKHEIIEEGFFTKNEIEEREIYWISYYDSFNNGYNTTEGGNISLWTQTELGKTIVSVAIKKLWQDKEYNRKNTNPVKCIENDYIFQSANEASILLQIDGTGIRACCRGKQKTAAGYHWELSNWEDYDIFYKNNPNYLEQFFIENSKKKEQEEISKQNKKETISTNKFKTKPVLCIDKDVAYKNCVSASTTTGADRAGINSCCLNKQNTCGGYSWKYITKDEYEKYKKLNKSDIPIPLIKSSQKVSVICVETNVVYESISEAHRQTGIKHIWDCCRGLLKTAGGYHWKTINEPPRTLDEILEANKAE